MSTITREAWGAAPAAKADPLTASRVIGLAFHWPAMSKPLRGIAAVSAALRDWQRYHMGKGWRDIAYQVAIDQDGNRYILRGLDGVSAANGDTIPNETYGAVLLVLAPGEKPSPAMVAEIKRVVADHRRLFPKSKLLVGHSQIRPEPTACPGPIVMALLKAGAFEPGPSPAEKRKRKLTEMIAAARKRIAKWKAERDQL